MTDIQYILATEQHIDMLIDLRIEFLTAYAGEQTPETVEVFRQNMRSYLPKALVSKDYISWIAVVDGNPAGVGGLAVRVHPGNFGNPTGRVGYIMNMYTVPAYRKNGIAAEIVNRLVQSGKEIGLTSFELHATLDGEPVYQKCGFVLHAEPTYRIQL